MGYVVFCAPAPYFSSVDTTLRSTTSGKVEHWCPYFGHVLKSHIGSKHIIILLDFGHQETGSDLPLWYKAILFCCQPWKQIHFIWNLHTMTIQDLKITIFCSLLSIFWACIHLIVWQSIKAYHHGTCLILGIRSLKAIIISGNKMCKSETKGIIILKNYIPVGMAHIVFHAHFLTSNDVLIEYL